MDVTHWDCTEFFFPFFRDASRLEVNRVFVFCNRTQQRNIINDINNNSNNNNDNNNINNNIIINNQQ